MEKPEDIFSSAHSLVNVRIFDFGKEEPGIENILTKDSDSFGDMPPCIVEYRIVLCG